MMKYFATQKNNNTISVGGLLVYEISFALFHKVRHALFLVMDGQQCVETASLEQSSSRQPALKGLIDAFFGHDGCHTRLAGDELRDLECCVEQGICRHDT